MVYYKAMWMGLSRIVCRCLKHLSMRFGIRGSIGSRRSLVQNDMCISVLGILVHERCMRL